MLSGLIVLSLLGHGQLKMKFGDRFHLGFKALGAGYNAPFGVCLEARYNTGASGIRKLNDWFPGHWYNRLMQVGITYNLSFIGK
ncbi:MAG: hypothetical protein JWP88_1283 [Flaviaesturariibacter sp.]|nr:hypothetical protein [Flaviaesturariibacter sp.]